MRQVTPHPIWIGHVGDVRDLNNILSLGITAIVDLALNEPSPVLPRDVTYCRFPLIDGAGNATWLLQAAIDVTVSLLRSETPTLVYCGAGMSRSPTIVAAALSIVLKCALDESLDSLKSLGPMDVSPGLWQDVKVVVDQRSHEPFQSPLKCSIKN